VNVPSTAIRETEGRRDHFDHLAPNAQVALLARTLWADGYRDNTSGHITVRDGETLLTNPFPLGWDEVRASDVVRIDLEGNKIEGDYDCSPAITLHVELLKARPDIGVVVHNHPEYATIWAALHRAPLIYDQTSAMLPGDVAIYGEYIGDVRPANVSQRNVAALGDGAAALLGNHGVLVVAPTVPMAHLRCIALERRCRLAWHVKVLGQAEGTPMPKEAADYLASAVQERRNWPYYYEAAARREIRRDPSVLH
jgi:ribulose-5-phosphate 4-epimerase/fuculose-1-phosphate aldolase